MGPDAAEVRAEDRQQEEEEEEEVRNEAQQQEKKQQEEEEEDAEERERVSALLQRKKLLRELGVVDQLHQLLQGRTNGGTQQMRTQAQQRQQQTKVRPHRSPK